MPNGDKVWVEAEQDEHGGVVLTLVDVGLRRRVYQQHGSHNVRTQLTALKNFPEQFAQQLQQGYPVRFKMFQHAFEALLTGQRMTRQYDKQEVFVEDDAPTGGLEGRVSMRSASEVWAKKHAALKDIFTLDDLAKEFDLPTVEDLDERNVDNVAEAGHYAYKYAIKDGHTEAEAEKIREMAEQEAQDEIFHGWHNAATRAMEGLFGEHGLELVPRTRDRYPFEYKLKPVKSWEDVADKIRRTINGVGMFEFRDLREFLESGPYTARAAALSHLHWIKSWSEVYGEPSARSVFDRAWR